MLVKAQAYHEKYFIFHQKFGKMFQHLAFFVLDDVRQVLSRHRDRRLGVGAQVANVIKLFTAVIYKFMCYKWLPLAGLSSLV
jgi:hypothetical protein